MSKYKYDEISVNNGKILLTIISCVSMIISTINASNFNGLFISSTTYYLSNLLAFYSVNPKSKSGAERRAKIVNLYMCIGATLFICFVLQTNLEFEVVKVTMFWLIRLIVFFTSFIAPYFAIKDDDAYKPKEVNDLKKKTIEKIRKEKEKRVFYNRDKNVRMNEEKKEFIEATDRKGTVEGRRR